MTGCRSDARTNLRRRRRRPRLVDELQAQSAIYIAAASQRRFGDPVETEIGGALEGIPFVLERPTTRGECPIARPCPWVSCKHHLLLRVDKTGAIKINTQAYRGTSRVKGQKRTMHPHVRNRKSERQLIDLAVESLFDMEESCALDVAEDGAHSWTAIGDLLAVTRERSRRIGLLAIETIRRSKTNDEGQQ